MVLIETGKFKSFEEYLSYLGKPAKKNHRYAEKHNAGVIHKEVGFAPAHVQYWMDLWGKQLIRGEYRQFAFGAEALAGKNILCFDAIEGENTIACQFVELSDGYMNCHPVMYDKQKYAKRYLSKFMWFDLIRWAIENGVEIVDLGGGNDDSWREMIRTRKEYPNPAYKWLYVPQFVKLNPEKERDYKVEHHGISKRISKID